jgi:hypothetical protein
MESNQVLTFLIVLCQNLVMANTCGIILFLLRPAWFPFPIAKPMAAGTTQTVCHAFSADDPS